METLKRIFNGIAVTILAIVIFAIMILLGAAFVSFFRDVTN